MKKFTVAACLLLLGTSIIAGEIALPKPNLKSGKPFMQCVAERRTERKFSTKPLSQQTIAEILFVADGVTRKDGRKTVPTARNKQNQKVYAAMQNGVWLYQAQSHSLKLVLKGDHRAAFGKQPFHKKAPVVLLYVSDLPAVGKNLTEQMLYSGNHSGHAAQNVYLYAASKGLSTVICGMLDRVALKKLMKLNKNQAVIFSQPVGYPAK